MNIDELLDIEPETWNPQEDGTPPKLVGEVIALNTGTGDWGEYPVVTVQNADGVFRWFAFGTVAKNQLETAAPQVGDKIGIKYAGKKISGAGNEYHNYRVVSEPVGPRVDTPTPAPPLPAAAPTSDNELGDDEDPF